MGEGGQTSTQKDTHINTMTRPGLWAGPSENVANCQQSALLHVYDIRPKTVNRVNNGQKQSKTVKNGQKR